MTRDDIERLEKLAREATAAPFDLNINADLILACRKTLPDLIRLARIGMEAEERERKLDRLIAETENEIRQQEIEAQEPRP